MEKPNNKCPLCKTELELNVENVLHDTLGTYITCHICKANISTLFCVSKLTNELNSNTKKEYLLCEKDNKVLLFDSIDLAKEYLEMDDESIKDNSINFEVIINYSIYKEEII